MRKDLKLVLSVFEGHGWRPREGHKAIVTAKLENHVVTTDPVLLTTEPKFFTELSWKLNKNLIRQYKVARVPIRVECLSVSKHGEHQSLGYIIVPLSTAVLGVKSDGKWFKLLGGRSSPHKNPPSLSLSLCLRDPETEDDEIVLSDDEEQVTDPHHGLKNGPREDHSFQKGISPRNVASRSPRRSLNSSYSPRTQKLQPSPRRSSRHLQDAHVYEEINENGTEMEIDEKYIKLEGVPAHHRNNHNSPMSLSREEHELNHSRGSGSHSHRNRHHNSVEIVPNCIDARDTQLNPQLNQDGGFFQIGPSNSPDEESFVLSITIVFAKNLDQLFPNEFTKTAEPACFSYSLLGCTIKTDSIDIKNPNFLAERAAGNIRSTGANLSAYFHKNSDLPVHLLVGDLCLASTCINLSVFENAAELSLHNNTLTVEGGFPLVPLVADPSDIEANKDPILGIVAELSRMSPSDVSVRHPSTMAKMKMENVFLNSLSEASSDGEDMDHQRQVCSTQRRRQNSFTGDLVEQKELASEIHKQRLQLLYAAAIEVETWKEDQQELFWKQWCARESELQQHLAAEWRVRVNSIEGNLQNQLAKCDTLQNRLTSALTNLSAREVIVKNREKKLKQLEDELEEQRQILKERDKGSTAEGRNLANDDVWEELVMERRARRALEKQVEELKGRALLAETKLKEDEKLAVEASRLHREKEKLSEQLAAAVSRKQYYKLQWVRAVSQLHQLHVAQAHDTLAIKSEVTRASSPEPFHPSSARMESLEDESLEERVLFLEPSTDARGNKVSPKNLHVQRKSGNGIVSEKASSHRQERHAEEEYEPRRRSGSGSRLVSREAETFSRTRKRIGSETGNRSNECIQLDVSGKRKRILQSSLNRSRQEELGTDGSEDERIGKSPRMSRMNRSHELERLMKERENLLETSDLELYESRIQSVEKKIREVVEL